MIHLFKKIYVTTDKIIDLGYDRIVVSQNHGLDVLEDLQKINSGKLISYSLEWSEILGSKDVTYPTAIDLFTKLADHCDATDKRVMIYCDDDSLQFIMSTWYKHILKTPTKDSVKSLLQAHVFKFNVFFRGRFSGNSGASGSEEILKLTNFDTIYDSVKAGSATKRKAFVKKYISTISVEHLFANYLHDKSTKAELKSVIKILLKKDIEKYLYELKEVFFVHFLTRKVADKFNLNAPYNFDNISGILDDTSDIAQVFIKDDMWVSKYMNIASSNNNVLFDNISASDLVTIRKFTQIIADGWSQFKLYDAGKSDVNKLDFIECITGEFTDTLLDSLIEMESTYDNESGSFFALSLETVNHYLIHSLLDAKSNADSAFLSRYITV